MTEARHPLERAVERLAALFKNEPEELRVWAVAALAHRLDLLVLVGDEALPRRRNPLDDEGPRYNVELVLADARDIYLESGDVLDLAGGVESVGRAWVGVVETMMDRHPEQRREILRAAYGVVEKLVQVVRERGLVAPVATSTRSAPRPSQRRCGWSSEPSRPQKPAG